MALGIVLPRAANDRFHQQLEEIHSQMILPENLVQNPHQFLKKSWREAEPQKLHDWLADNTIAYQRLRKALETDAQQFESLENGNQRMRSPFDFQPHPNIRHLRAQLLCCC